MLSIQRIISQVLKSPATLAQLRTALVNPLAVPQPAYRTIVEFAGGFWDKYQSLPQNGDWEIWLSSLEGDLREGVISSLGELQALPSEEWTPAYIGVEVAKALKEVALRNGVARLNTMMPNPPPDALAVLTKEVESITPVSISGLKNLADVRKNIYSVAEGRIITPSGFEGLDRNIRGFQAELVFVLADSGVGKTSLLINLGVNAALRGSRVFHITCELSADNTLGRYYRRIAESTPKQVRDCTEVVINRAEQWVRYAKGSVHVLYQEPYCTGVEELEGLISQYKQLHGDYPDVVVLDYLDLLRQPHGVKGDYEGLGKLSHMIRSLGVRNESVMISATQATRSSHRVAHLYLDMMGDSYQKVRAADIVIGFLQTDEEYQAFQGRLSLLKVRENPGRGVEVPCYVNLDYMRISDLDSVDTQRLIRQEGHIGVPVFQEEES